MIVTCRNSLRKSPTKKVKTMTTQNPQLNFCKWISPDLSSRTIILGTDQFPRYQMKQYSLHGHLDQQHLTFQTKVLVLERTHFDYNTKLWRSGNCELQCGELNSSHLCVVGWPSIHDKNTLKTPRTRVGWKNLGCLKTFPWEVLEYGWRKQNYSIAALPIQEN